MNEPATGKLSSAEVDAFFSWLDSKGVTYACTRHEFKSAFSSKADTQTMRWLCQWLIDTHAKRLPNLSSLVTILKTSEPANAPPVNRPESEVHNQRHRYAESEERTNERNYSDEFIRVRGRCSRLADRIQRQKLSSGSQKPITSQKRTETDSSPA